MNEVNPSSGQILLIMIIMVSTAVCPVAGFFMARKRCAPAIGVALGFFLGPIGLLILLLFPQQSGVL